MYNSQLFRIACSGVTFFLVFIVLLVVASAATLVSTVPLAATGNILINEIKPDESQTEQRKYVVFEKEIDLQITDYRRSQYDQYTVDERLHNGYTMDIPNEWVYGEKVVYLTFDDGPDATLTPQVLAILHEYNVKATFFLVGNQCQKYPDLVKNIFQAGHAIGNHSYNHNYKQLYASPQDYINQLKHTDEIIKSILELRPRISRAPGGTVGSFNKEYWSLLKRSGYLEVGWNISSGDASSAKAQQILDNVMRQLQNKALWSHAIVLMHDGTGHQETVKALPAIITYLKQQGFEFRIVSSHTPPAW